ncbi:MAG TPA: RNA 2',3'-cyclic phosphodiesterase [Firmicutes bacterium]|jgi:2'-5' RNA ligase|nr:RNA 2',3'-cyclic phosphodiesterase [Bacillota bacterium]
MRLFYAVFIPGKIRESITRAAGPLHEIGMRANWTTPENWHFTLRFMGEMAPDKLKSLEQAANDCATRVPAFDLELSGMGVFERGGIANLLWIGIGAGRKELALLAAGLDDALAMQGYGVRDKAFKPHLTLARIKERNYFSGSDSMLGKALAIGQKMITPGLGWPVTSFALVESTLKPSGPQYSIISKYDLQ